MSINNPTGTMEHQIDDMLHVKEIIKKLNNMPPSDRKYYRDMLILTILYNTTNSHEEFLGNIEIMKIEYWNKFIKI